MEKKNIKAACKTGEQTLNNNTVENRLDILIKETNVAYIKVLLSKEVGLFSLVSFNWNFR